MHPYLTLLLRMILGGTWTYAAIAKLLDREASVRAVAGFGLLPERFAAFAGRALPLVELALGILLLAGWWTRPAATASAALLVVFGLAIGVNLARGNAVECHCFGQSQRGPVTWAAVGRNGLLAVAAASLAITRVDYLSLQGWATGAVASWAAVPPRDFIPVALLALAAGLAWRLCSASWEAAMAVAAVDSGPAVRWEVRRRLRRWLRR